MDALDPHPCNPVVVQGTASRILFTRMACRLVSHVHREHQTIFHCGGAVAVFRVGGAVHLLRPGEMVLVNPWQEHEKLAGPEGESVLLSVLFDPAEADVDQPARANAFSFRCTHGVVLHPLRRALDATVRALIAAQTSSAAGLDCVLAELVSTIIGTCLKRDADHDGPLARPHDFRIQRALQFILRSDCADLRVGDLPALAGVSRSHFFRQFRRCLGVSPHYVIDYVQIKAAIQRLASDRQPIRTITHDLGFTTNSHFARFFAHHLGTTPSRYRRGILLV
jgi:AraC-like DNA-binding protein